MPLYKSLIFLFLLLVSSSLILPFRYSLFLFLNVLLVSLLKFLRSAPLIWLGFYYHYNLACFHWYIIFEHSSSNHGLLCFSLWYPGLSLVEVLIFSLILSQASLMSKLSSKLCKAANLFEISTWYSSLTSTSSSFFRSNLSKPNFCLAVYLLKFSPSIFPLPASGQYHSQLLYRIGHLPTKRLIVRVTTWYIGLP
jgi:hypothetical protein